MLNILADTGFDWCADNSGVISVFGMIKIALNLLRFAIPIGLIIMTVLDVSKNVINVDDKDSMKTIGNRIISAVIVFLVPTLVNLVFKIVNYALDENVLEEDSLADCWEKAGD